MRLFQRITVYSSHAFAVLNLLRLPLLLCARVLDTPFGERSKAESLATSVVIALVLASYCDGEAEFQCQLVPVEAVTLCFGSKMHVLNKQGDVHFAKGSVVY